MRLKQLEISFKLLEQWIKGDFSKEKIKTNLPEDTKIINVLSTFKPFVFRIIIESKEFEEVENPSEFIPTFEIIIEIVN